MQKKNFLIKEQKPTNERNIDTQFEGGSLR